ncbi:MAG: hypothetical protein HQL31_13930, partial [Planctomycetes bacterium]|nr:hypothetical protein [Planctomycetota bacterium]
MFEFMIKWQRPLLIVAGVVMALFFGLGGIMDLYTNSGGEAPSYNDGMSVNERREIFEKLKIRSLD